MRSWEIQIRVSDLQLWTNLVFGKTFELFQPSTIGKIYTCDVATS